MSQFKSACLQELQRRGFIYQATDLDALDAAMCAGPIAAYIGFDATAATLHVGSLTQIMLLRILQRHGHKAVALIGGGTTRIGDPSGRDETRQMLTDEVIDKNAQGLRRVLGQFLDPKATLFVNNADWLTTMGYIDVLRTYGRYFSVNRMLTAESIKSRLEREQNMSFIEFNYMILQSIDFVELYRRHGVQLQLGGSDQWGNIVAGVDLARRMENITVYGLTTPLVTTSAGTKMGKTAQGAVWLTVDDLSSFDYWQFWRNTPDADVGRFLRLFTDLPMAEIERLEGLTDQAINEAKIYLADATTAMAHGAAVLPEVHQATQALFEGGGGDAGGQTYTLKAIDEAGVSVVELLHDVGFCASKGEAKKLIRGGGAFVDGVAVSDEGVRIMPEALAGGSKVKLSAGKKKHIFIVRA